MDKSKWEYKKLGEVATFLNGYAFKPENWSKHGLKIIRIQNLTDKTAPYNCYDGDIDSKYIVRKGDLLISWSATLGAFLWDNNDALLNQHIFKTIFDKSDIDKYYLKYCVISKLEEMAKKSHGVTMRHITKKDFDNTIIPYPSLLDQQRIVAELDCLNEMIAVKQEQLKEFDELAQSIFYDMFGDIMLNDKAWPVHKWKELFETKLGKMLDKKKQNEGDTSLPYLANANVLWGRFDLKDLKTMTFNDKEMDVFSLKKNDLLICEGGESGRCAIWMEEKTDIKFQKAIHRARMKDKSLIIPLYAMYYMKEIKDKGGLKNYVSKATIEHLTGEKLNQVPVPLPHLALQQQFADKISAIEAQKELVKQSIAETQTLLDYTMDYYFN